MLWSSFLPQALVVLIGHGVTVIRLPSSCDYLVQGSWNAAALGAGCHDSNGALVESDVNVRERIGFRAPTAELPGALVPTEK